MEILQGDNLKAMPGIRHGFFTREWGDGGSGTIHRPETSNNRGRVAMKLGITPANILSCYQIHSPTVAVVTEAWSPDARPQADAMVTSVKGMGLGILTADCVPVLFADPKSGVIGAAHAGWRGAISGVLENTLDAMEKLGANRKSVEAAIGPCIWQRSYEVGPEFPAPFVAENPDNERFFQPAFREDHTMFDLPGYVEAKLHNLRIGSVTPSPADTCADETRFFSYRRTTLRNQPREGNLISVIVLAA